MWSSEGFVTNDFFISFLLTDFYFFVIHLNISTFFFELSLWIFWLFWNIVDFFFLLLSLRYILGVELVTFIRGFLLMFSRRMSVVRTVFFHNTSGCFRENTQMMIKKLNPYSYIWILWIDLQKKKLPPQKILRKCSWWKMYQ